jgi:hypothetical protein
MLLFYENKFELKAEKRSPGNFFYIHLLLAHRANINLLFVRFLTKQQVEVICLQTTKRTKWTCPSKAPAEFLFWRMKDKLVSVSLDQHILKMAWEGVTRRITAEEFATTFRRWYKRCQQCTNIRGNYVEKRRVIMIHLASAVVEPLSSLVWIRIHLVIPCYNAFLDCRHNERCLEQLRFRTSTSLKFYIYIYVFIN